MKQDKCLPKLSVIVPSYNQGSFIEETLLSIINQNYPNKELIVIDGGSTDNSIEIIKKYEAKIDYWISEKDSGQSEAINKGFKLATGEYITWLNSDDVYYPNGLMKVFCLNNIVDYDFIYGPVSSGKEFKQATCINSKENSILSLFNLLHFFYKADYIIPSQSVFIKSEFLKKSNIDFLNENLHYCMDLEWYCRIALKNPAYYKYNFPIAFFRVNEFTKTISQSEKMNVEAVQIFYSYKKFLTNKQALHLTKTVLLEKFLKRMFNQKSKMNIIVFLRIIKKIPKQSLRDKRFLGMIKKYVLEVLHFKKNKPSFIVNK